MPGMNKYKKTPKKLMGRNPRASMKGKGMPRGSRKGGPSMPAKGR